MSNPGVIILDSVNSKKNKIKRFQIEDNIGEAIHLHIDNICIYFTIQEFFEFSKIVRESLLRLEILPGYTIENFDEHFLKECANFLPYLKKIVIEEIELSKIKCIIHTNYRSDLNMTKLVHITEISAYKYLKGDKADFLDYSQHNYFNMDNETRLLQTLNSIQKNGYPHEDQYLILFNGQDIIRDGQHRAAILAHLYGLDYKAKIMRFYFDGQSHLMQIEINNFKVALRWFAEKAYRNLKRYIKNRSLN